MHELTSYPTVIIDHRWKSEEKNLVRTVKKQAIAAMKIIIIAAVRPTPIV